MQYNQPYGTAANTSFVNGDPSVGRAGSIPPAEAIEMPQREIVNLINDVAIYVPDNADLHQLGKSIQSSKMTYAVDAGTVNSASITLVPSPVGYNGGLTLRVKMATGNTGAATLNVNALGAKPIIKANGAPLLGGEWNANDIVELCYDGTSFQCIGGQSKAGLVFLSASRSYFVNATTGLDTNDGLSATVTGGHGPFQTIQRAITACQAFNLNGFDITVNIADGAYTGPVTCPTINGSGTIHITGNTGSPANVTVSSSTGSAIIVNGGPYIIGGVNPSVSATIGGDPGDGIHTGAAGVCTVNAVKFNFCVNAHLSGSGSISVIGPVTISGGGHYHMQATVGGNITLNPVSPPVLTISAAANFTVAYAGADNLGVVYGNYSSITGSANVTGPKYTSTTNSIINTLGSGINYYPGTVAGTTSSGGQYA